MVEEAPVEVDLRERERRLYDRLRAKVAAPRPGERSGFRDLLLLLPDMVVLLARLARDSRVPLAAKLIAFAGIGYALSPIDLLPEFIFGPFGFADDLLVVGAALSRILRSLHPDLVRAHWPGNGDALDAIRRLTGWAESLVGRSLARVLGFREIR